MDGFILIASLKFGRKGIYPPRGHQTFKCVLDGNPFLEQALRQYVYRFFWTKGKTLQAGS